MDLRSAADVRPETPAELHQYIKTYLRTDTGEKINIPVRRMCPGHAAPFEFVSDAFFGLHNRQFVHANRNGGKTLNFGVIDWLGMKFHGRDYPLNILSIGAIEKQAIKCFGYTASLWRQPEFRREVGKGILKKSIALQNGTQLEISPLTMNAVNSPHVPWLNCDEWELGDWDLWQQALSIPKSAGPHRAATRIASTQKYALGNVQTFKENATRNGYKVYKWCIWETIEQCRDRSCSSCPIYNWPDREGGVLCGGRAKEARGFYAIDDFIDRVHDLDRSTLEEEWLCLRPSREGLVFGREYNEDVHRVGYPIPFDPDSPLYMTLDQGFTNPYAVEIIQIDRRGTERFIGEVYQTETLAEDMGRRVADLLEELGVSSGRIIPAVYDREDPASARTFVKHLTSTRGTQYHASLKQPAGRIDLNEWLRLCRRRLKLTTGGPPKLVISSRVHWFPWELTQYRYPQRKGEERPSSEKPVDKDNHAVSAWYRFEAWLKRPMKARSGAAEIM